MYAIYKIIPTAYIIVFLLIAQAPSVQEEGLDISFPSDGSVNIWTSQNSSSADYYAMETSTNLTEWKTQDDARLGDGGFIGWNFPVNKTTRFFRFTKPFNPQTTLDLDGSLDDSANPGAVASPTNGAALFATGRTDHLQAYVLDGTNQLDLVAPGSMSNLTVCMYIYLDDLQGATPMLFDSGTQPGNIRLYFRDNHSGVHTGDGKDRDVRLVFQVIGNDGGNGTTGECVESTYRRFAEHSLDFVNDSGHERKTRQLWLHLAVSYNPSSNCVYFYINGKHDSTRHFSTSQSPVLGSFRIGSEQDGSNPIIGKVSDFGLYDSVLPSEKVRALGDFRSDLWAWRDSDKWMIDRTYHVDAVNGNDTNNASAAAPLKTITKAIERINTLTTWKAQGSRVLIKPGTYREGEIYLEENGTRLKPIVIEAETPGTVIISGSEVWDDNAWVETSTGSGIWTHNWPYDFGRDTANTNAIDHSTERRFRRELLFLDGNMCRPYTQLSDLESGTDPHSTFEFMTDEHAFYVDETADLVYLRTTQNPNNRFVEVGVREWLMRFNLYYNNCDYVVVRGLRFQHTASFNNKPPLDIVGSHHVLIEDCDFVDNGSAGLGSTAGYDTLIRRCRFLRNGRSGFKLARGYSNALVQDCVVERNHWRNTLGNYTDPDLSGIGKVMFSSRIHLERVRVAQHKQIGFWADAQNWDTTVDDCYFTENNSAIWFEISTLNQEALNSAFYENLEQGIMLAGENIRLVNNCIEQTDVSGAWGLLSTLYYDYRDEQQYVPDIYMGTDAQLLGNTISGSNTNAKLIRFQNSTFIADSMLSISNIFHSASTLDSFYTPSQIGFTTWQGLFHDTGSKLLPVDAMPFENDGNVVVDFASTIARVPETQCAQLPIKLTKQVNTPITVDVTVESLTATEGTDFRVVGAGTVLFSPLQQTHMVNIPILRDYTTEGEESFRLHLSNPTGALLGANTNVNITIPASWDTALQTFIPSYNALETIQGEAFDESHEINEIVGVGFGRFRKTHWAKFQNTDFGNTSPTNLVVNMAVPVGRGGKQIEFRLDSDTGPLIATVSTIETDPNTTSDERTWDVFLPMPDAAVTGATGVRDLYIVNKWDYENCGVVESFFFQ